MLSILLLACGPKEDRVETLIRPSRLIEESNKPMIKRTTAVQQKGYALKNGSLIKR
jgi:hypothetical protein